MWLGTVLDNQYHVFRKPCIMASCTSDNCTSDNCTSVTVVVLRPCACWMYNNGCWVASEFRSGAVCVLPWPQCCTQKWLCMSYIKHVGDSHSSVWGRNGFKPSTASSHQRPQAITLCVRVYRVWWFILCTVLLITASVMLHCSCLTVDVVRMMLAHPPHVGLGACARRWGSNDDVRVNVVHDWCTIKHVHDDVCVYGFVCEMPCRTNRVSVCVCVGGCLELNAVAQSDVVLHEARTR
jgi:hypothetical protein